MTCQAVILGIHDDMTPEALLVEVANGDQSAFVAFYDQLARSVYGVVVKVLRDPSQAEEVTQEVFVEVWRQAPRYDLDRASAKTWTLTIAHRRAVDRVRSEQSERTRIERFGTEDLRKNPLAPADLVVEQSERNEAVVALGSLNDDQRAVIVLAYYQGLTHQEIARHLDVPLGTVKSRARQGLIRLRALMGMER